MLYSLQYSRALSWDPLQDQMGFLYHTKRQSPYLTHHHRFRAPVVRATAAGYSQQLFAGYIPCMNIPRTAATLYLELWFSKHEATRTAPSVHMIRPVQSTTRATGVPGRNEAVFGIYLIICGYPPRLLINSR